MLAFSVREAIRDAIAAFGKWGEYRVVTRQPRYAGTNLLGRAAGEEGIEPSAAESTSLSARAPHP